jgi:hypothetical protein
MNQICVWTECDSAANDDSHAVSIPAWLSQFQFTKYSEASLVLRLLLKELFPSLSLVILFLFFLQNNEEELIGMRND